MTEKTYFAIKSYPIENCKTPLRCGVFPDFVKYLNHYSAAEPCLNVQPNQVCRFFSSEDEAREWCSDEMAENGIKRSIPVVINKSMLAFGVVTVERTGRTETWFETGKAFLAFLENNMTIFSNNGTAIFFNAFNTVTEAKEWTEIVHIGENEEKCFA